MVMKKVGIGYKSIGHRGQGGNKEVGEFSLIEENPGGQGKKQAEVWAKIQINKREEN